MTVIAHLLDCTHGRGAADVPVRLEQQDHGSWREVAVATTGVDGTVGAFQDDCRAQLGRGAYRLTFETSCHFAGLGQEPFYQEIAITFIVTDPSRRSYFTVLILPHGYLAYHSV